MQIEGSSYRMRQHADLLPQAQRPGAAPAEPPHRRRSRPPKAAAGTAHAG
jgi:hypothetical protein